MQVNTPARGEQQNQPCAKSTCPILPSTTPFLLLLLLQEQWQQAYLWTAAARGDDVSSKYRSSFPSTGTCLINKGRSRRKERSARNLVYVVLRGGNTHQRGPGLRGTKV